MKQLSVVAELDIGLLHLAGDFDINGVGAVDHDIGDVIPGEQRFQRSIAEDVVADIAQEIVLFGDRHDDLFRSHNIGNDFADCVASLDGVHLGQLRHVDGFDQGCENLALQQIIFVGFRHLRAYYGNGIRNV